MVVLSQWVLGMWKVIMKGKCFEKEIYLKIPEKDGKLYQIDRWVNPGKILCVWAANAE